MESVPRQETNQSTNDCKLSCIPLLTEYNIEYHLKTYTVKTIKKLQSMAIASQSDGHDCLYNRY